MVSIKTPTFPTKFSNYNGFLLTLLAVPTLAPNLALVLHFQYILYMAPLNNSLRNSLQNKKSFCFKPCPNVCLGIPLVFFLQSQAFTGPKEMESTEAHFFFWQGVENKYVQVHKTIQLGMRGMANSELLLARILIHISSPSLATLFMNSVRLQIV